MRLQYKVLNVAILFWNLNTSPEKTQNLSIEVDVDAPNEAEATTLGKERISKEFDLFALCAENPLYLDENRTWTDGV